MIAIPIEMNITGTLHSDKLSIFRVWGQDPRVYVVINCLSAIRMREKTGTGLQVWLQIFGWR